MTFAQPATEPATEPATYPETMTHTELLDAVIDGLPHWDAEDAELSADIDELATEPKHRNKYVRFRRFLAGIAEDYEETHPGKPGCYRKIIFPEWSLNPPPAVGLQAVEDVLGFLPAEHLAHPAWKFVLSQNCQHFFEPDLTVADCLHSISIAYHAARQKARAAGLPVSD